MWLLGRKPIRSNDTMPTTSFRVFCVIANSWQSQSTSIFCANDVMFCALRCHQFSIFEVMGDRQPWDCVLNLSQHAKNITFYYINTNEIPGELLRENLISSHVKITCSLHMWKYHLCYGYIVNRAFHTKKLLKWNGLVFHWCLYNK